MHKVNRFPEPESLKKNSKKWTVDLLAEVPKYSTVNDIPQKFVNKYRQEDVKHTLHEMFEGLCCFCESPIGVQVFERIEHLMPKSKFPHLCFEWSNLNYSCEVCNSPKYKGDKWDDQNPILDPTFDEIKNYLEIDIDTANIMSINNDLRAKTTIEHTGLNREGLIERRGDITNKLKKLLGIAIKSGAVEEFKDIIKSMSKSWGYPLLMNTFADKL
ncbi:MAG: retron system putative HNH endonuclease [Desulfitobacteriaceae bacterium]